MRFFPKFLIATAIIGIVGILVFILDLSNLSWNNNRESYWGIIAMLALIGSIILNYRSEKLAKKIKNIAK